MHQGQEQAVCGSLPPISLPATASLLDQLSGAFPGPKTSRTASCPSITRMAISPIRTSSWQVASSISRPLHNALTPENGPSSRKPITSRPTSGNARDRLPQTRSQPTSSVSLESTRDTIDTLLATTTSQACPTLSPMTPPVFSGSLTHNLWIILTLPIHSLSPFTTGTRRAPALPP